MINNIIVIILLGDLRVSLIARFLCLFLKKEKSARASLTWIEEISYSIPFSVFHYRAANRMQFYLVKPIKVAVVKRSLVPCALTNQ